MPLTSFLGAMLKSGKVTVSTNNVKALEITAYDKKIDIDALNKQFIKDTLGVARGSMWDKGPRGSLNMIKTARNSLDGLRGIAQDLSDSGLTVTFSYKGNVVVTLGSKANPVLSDVITGTKAIEINSPRKFVELVL